jgi:hypothetical protein
MSASDLGRVVDAQPMKIATLIFTNSDARLSYRDELRARMIGAGYKLDQISEVFDDWFPPQGLKAHISGTADAERAADVALGLRGVTCRLKDAE